jgi:hypothetical protein
MSPRLNVTIITRKRLKENKSNEKSGRIIRRKLRKKIRENIVLKGR